MSGSPMLSARCHAINAVGTKNIIAACQQLQQQQRVKEQQNDTDSGSRSRHAAVSLLFLSTYNVVFGGQEILGGSEDTPYFQGTHSDQYAPSKTLAEQAVLAVCACISIICVGAPLCASVYMCLLRE